MKAWNLLFSRAAVRRSRHLAMVNQRLASAKRSASVLAQQQLQSDHHVANFPAKWANDSVCEFQNKGDVTEHRAREIDHPAVLVSDRVSNAVLEELFSGSVSAVIVPDFVSREARERLATYFLTSDMVEKYDHEVYIDVEEDGVVKRKPQLQYYGVDRVGEPFNRLFSSSRLKDEAAKDSYFRSAEELKRGVREACSPYLSPVDKLRVELDDEWKDGARVGTFEGRKQLVGIGRIMHADLSAASEEQPHVDMLPQMIDPLDGQFSANMYLIAPQQGGALQVWDVPALTPEEVEKLDPNHDWKSELPDPLNVRPDAGDLVLVNTRKPHAITAFSAGMRVSVQTFIGLRYNKPLVMWN